MCEGARLLHINTHPNASCRGRRRLRYLRMSAIPSRARRPPRRRIMHSELLNTHFTFIPKKRAFDLTKQKLIRSDLPAVIARV